MLKRGSSDIYAICPNKQNLIFLITYCNEFRRNPNQPKERWEQFNFGFWVRIRFSEVKCELREKQKSKVERINYMSN